MGNIGPTRQRYEVLAVPAFGIEDADLWLLDTRAPEPSSEQVTPESADASGNPARPKA